VLIAINAHFDRELLRGVEVYNNFHALIVINAKKHCRKKRLCRMFAVGGLRN
jgi:endonuclease III-like uncharacterized protein